MEKYNKEGKVPKLVDISNKYISQLKKKEKVSKYFYKILSTNWVKYQTLQQESWQRKLNEVFDDSFWIMCIKMPFKITDDTKLHLFNIKNTKFITQTSN